MKKKQTRALPILGSIAGYVDEEKGPNADFSSI